MSCRSRSHQLPFAVHHSKLAAIKLLDNLSVFLVENSPVREEEAWCGRPRSTNKLVFVSVCLHLGKISGA